SGDGQPAGDRAHRPTPLWGTFMQNEFSSLPVEQLPSPNFSCGTASGGPFVKWDQVPINPKKGKATHQSPNPFCRPGTHPFGAFPQPAQPPNPFPTSPVPSPSPSPSPSP